MLLKLTGINEHAIELKKGKQSLYRPIYNLGLLELITFKIYIKINLTNKFMQPLKCPTGTLIAFLFKNSMVIYTCLSIIGV